MYYVNHHILTSITLSLTYCSFLFSIKKLNDTKTHINSANKNLENKLNPEIF